MLIQQPGRVGAGSSGRGWASCVDVQQGRIVGAEEQACAGARHRAATVSGPHDPPMLLFALGVVWPPGFQIVHHRLGDEHPAEQDRMVDLFPVAERAGFAVVVRRVPTLFAGGRLEDPDVVLGVALRTQARPHDHERAFGRREVEDVFTHAQVHRLVPDSPARRRVERDEVKLGFGQLAQVDAASRVRAGLFVAAFIEIHATVGDGDRRIENGPRAVNPGRPVPLSVKTKKELQTIGCRLQ